jgi:hypothetical protein
LKGNGMDIVEIEGGYFLGEDLNSDSEVAEYLNIPLESLIDIMKECGAYNEKSVYDTNYYFYTLEDAEKALTILEPYIILANLTK